MASTVLQCSRYTALLNITSILCPLTKTKASVHEDVRSLRGANTAERDSGTCDMELTIYNANIHLLEGGLSSARIHPGSSSLSAVSMATCRLTPQHIDETG